MNSLLKVQLVENTRHGSEVFAEVSVICKNEEIFKVFERFFSCFDQKISVYPWFFSTKAEVAPVWEMTNDSKFAEELVEDDPFGIGEYAMGSVWHDLNEWLYSDRYEKIVKGGAVA